MNTSTFAADLTAWALQTALLLGVGLLLPALFRFREPRACLAYWQGLLVAVILLPLAQSPLGSLPGTPAFSEEMAVSALSVFDSKGTIGGEGWSPSLLLIAVLGVGAAGRLAWLGLGMLSLRAYRRGARPTELAPEVAEVAERVGARARLLVSPKIESPVTFGWWHPVVLLPAGFAALPAEAQRGIVCHELLHVRRRDWLFALWEEAVRALFWFHPAVWMLLARIALSREQVVDREAVRLTGSRRAYLEALRTVAVGSWRATAPGLPFFHRGHLRERVAHLCKEVPMSRSRITALVTTFAGLLAITAVLGVLAFPMAGTAWAGTKPIPVEGDVQRPEKTAGAPPVYPEEARSQGLEGRVIMTSVIDERGKVNDLEVQQSSGHPSLDQAALDALSTWTFKPATLHGKPVAVFYTFTMKFEDDKKGEKPAQP